MGKRKSPLGLSRGKTRPSSWKLSEVQRRAWGYHKQLSKDGTREKAKSSQTQSWKLGAQEGFPRAPEEGELSVS